MFQYFFGYGYNLLWIIVKIKAQSPQSTTLSFSDRGIQLNDCL